MSNVRIVGCDMLADRMHNNTNEERLTQVPGQEDTNGICGNSKWDF